MLYEQIKQTFPNLEDNKFSDGTIVLQNDSDGVGDYIKEWNLDKSEYPLPSGLSVGKPKITEDN